MLKIKLKLGLQIYTFLGIQLIVNTLIFSLNAQEINSENWQKECRPEIDQSQNQNIIGYGSLMESKSRLLSTPNIKKAYPAMVSGYRRGWYVNNPNNPRGATFLGVVPDTNKQLNAVVYTLPEKSEIKNLDRREGGYCRQEIKPDQLQILSGNLPSGQFWIYSHLSEPKNPNPNAPIVQSYVDIFLAGCLEQEEEYKLKNINYFQLFSACFKT
jgi:hypothetical protein